MIYAISPAISPLRLPLFALIPCWFR